jgi:hypothetical protein
MFHLVWHDWLRLKVPDFNGPSQPRVIPRLAGIHA